MRNTEFLQNFTFGERVAEDESSKLQEYFVTTAIWQNVYEGKIDVIYGSKGSGKSAIYSILEGKGDELFVNNVLIATAENPRGNTVFGSLSTEPPTGEIEFVRLWKLYIVIISNSVFLDWDIQNAKVEKLNSILEEAGLTVPSKSLASKLRMCFDYIKSLTKFESIEPSLAIDDVSGLPNGVACKITFREPNNEDQKRGAVSIDEVYGIINDILDECGFSLWILIDRLDVAFSDHPELETNALRALFITYNDLKAYDKIKLKIFLRDDIWKRITESGFREASHITKTVTITWEKETLLNLIIYRALNNKEFIRKYNIDREKVLDNYSQQEELFYRMFPEQIDPGEKRPKSLDWILSRVKDGLGVIAPRELIHLLNECVSEQIKLGLIGDDNAKGEQMFSSVAIKKALSKVSKVRLEQTIYAEYPALRGSIQQLTGEKGEHTVETLVNVWKVSLDESERISQELIRIGIFEEKGSKQQPRFWIPFLYRSELKIVQGSAD